ncbi:uncharacterized protein LOC107042662 [Diachasma alloeum]|uniref:uncharacterized protein LOC107042662 n=1 Tax=Diachasma alloeum TaxID=454923 RepID=UPI0007383C7E|nr:uncharacterized protein LOC107042662 [Diachasma alloeum]
MTATFPLEYHTKSRIWVSISHFLDYAAVTVSNELVINQNKLLQALCKSLNRKVSTIGVRYQNDLCKFELKEDRILLSRQLCRMFAFKSHVALFYRKDGDIYSVEVDENDNFIINAGITEVEVQTFKNPPGVNQSETKAKRVKEIMETIRKSKSLSSDGDPIKSLTASQLKGSKSSTKVQKEKKPLTSKIQFGWLHKPAKAAKFCQMKGVFGGVRSVTLGQHIYRG